MKDYDPHKCETLGKAGGEIECACPFVGTVEDFRRASSARDWFSELSVSGRAAVESAVQVGDPTTACARAFADALRQNGATVDDIYFAGKSHTDPILEDPLSGGPDRLMETLLEKLEVGVLVNNVGISYAFPQWLHELTVSHEQLRKAKAAQFNSQKVEDSNVTPPPAPSPAKMDPKTARAILDAAFAQLKANKDSLTKTIQDIENAPGDASSKQMQKMMQLLPKVQQLVAPALTEHGFKPDELMSVVMKIQACAADDPSIAQDTMKLMKAAQGDISGLV